MENLRSCSAVFERVVSDDDIYLLDVRKVATHPLTITPRCTRRHLDFLFLHALRMPQHPTKSM